MGTPIKSNIPLVQRQEVCWGTGGQETYTPLTPCWNWRNVAIQIVCILAAAILTAYMSGLFEIPAIPTALMGVLVGVFMFDVLELFFPLKVWEVRNVRRIKF